MEKNGVKKYFAIFILAVSIIAVYKAFDNIGKLLGLIGSFFDLLTPFFVALVISFLLYPICVMIERSLEKRKAKFIKKHRRGISVFTVFSVFFAIVFVILWFLIPALARSISNLIEFVVNDLPTSIEIVVAKVNSMGFYLDQPHSVEYWKEFISPEKLLEVLSRFSVSDIGIYIGKILSASSFLIDLVISLIVSVYVLLDREDLKNGLRYFIRNTTSQNTRKHLLRYFDMAIEFLYKYIFCALLDAILVFILSAIVLSIIDVEYALLLALMIGVLNLIPYFGAISGTLISAIVTCFTNDFTTAIILVVSMIVLLQIDANVIQPRLINKQFSIKPFWVIFGVVVGGGLFGIPGIIFAIPTMALIKEIICDGFRWKVKVEQSKKDNLEKSSSLVETEETGTIKD